MWFWVLFGCFFFVCFGCGSNTLPYFLKWSVTRSELLNTHRPKCKQLIRKFWSFWTYYWVYILGYAFLHNGFYIVWLFLHSQTLSLIMIWLRCFNCHPLFVFSFQARPCIRRWCPVDIQSLFSTGVFRLLHDERRWRNTAHPLALYTGPFIPSQQVAQGQAQRQQRRDPGKRSPWRPTWTAMLTAMRSATRVRACATVWSMVFIRKWCELQSPARPALHFPLSGARLPWPCYMPSAAWF